MNVLKEAREKKFLTQEELAKKVGIARSVIAMIETNEHYRTSVPTAKKLAKELGFDWKLLF